MLDLVVREAQVGVAAAEASSSELIQVWIRSWPW